MTGDDPNRSASKRPSLSQLPSRLLRENLLTTDSAPRLEAKLFFEGERRRAYLERFWVLLSLAVIIATMGLLGDSTATVIGAMIVAPLMTPIMATAAALVTGRLDRAATSILLVLAGVAAVVGLAWIIGKLYSGVIDFETNGQLAARIAPRVIDLFAALASGAAGAFCMSREDIADSLPGVAIAISLVPPLCVVGLAMSIGEWDAARGALLLFVTNALAILLAGGGVLAMLGLATTTVGQLRGNARRNAFIAIVISVALVTVPLVATGRVINDETRERQRIWQATERWLAETDYALRAVEVRGDDIAITITGAGDPPSFAALEAAIIQATGHPIVVELEVVPSLKQRTSGAPAGGAR